MAAGTMISSGLFLLPGLAFAVSGPAVVVAYALASILVIPAMLSRAELSTAMPKAGGSYFFVKRSLGALAGILAGVADWFSLSLKSAFALLGIGAFAALAYPDVSSLQVKLIAIGSCMLFTALNLFSIESVSRAQIPLVLVLLGILSLYTVEGLSLVKVERFADFVPFGIESVFATAGIVFVSYGGLTKIANVAEEVHLPGRNIPLGMFLAFFVVALLYVVVVFVTVGTVEPEALAGSLTPISLGASASMGRIGCVALAVAAILAFIAAANAGIAAASRVPLAMSRDGLLPSFMGWASPVRAMPYVAILTTSGFMVLVIGFLSIEELVKTASTMMLLLFALDNLAVIVMRASRVQGYRPIFRAPLYPWMQALAITSYGFLILEMGLLPILITGAFGLLGLLWYAAYYGVCANRQSALIHLVERVTSRKLVDGTLEEELRKIVHERDKIVEDRFDGLIRRCEVLDIERAIPASQMFAAVAAALAPRLGISESTLLELFLERERESSTVVGHGIAIPHVIAEGKGLFDMALVRCKQGIFFSDAHPHVHTAFILVGSSDQRNYHLRALMAIAHIAQEHGFDQKWLEATSIQQMRDMLLLSGRKRTAV
ncbi:MAG: amino acid permease [Candidatus Coatesbacteria bacterium]|nr:amino acid permease [Candidatus Coatesbacteria bacterium]